MGVSRIHLGVPIQQQKNYITGTDNFNSNEDNFRALSSQGIFE